MNVLVIEDEQNVSAFIKKGLEEHDINVTVANDGETGLELASENEYDVIVLDVILPNMSGLEVCQSIRENINQSVPILMLTALSSTDNVVKGLELGADDYMPKPFKFKELLARVKALNRRAQNLQNSKVMHFEDLEMDLESKIVKRDGQQIKLTSREFLLLEFFMKNPKKVLSRIEIMENVWNVNFDLGTNVVEVYVNYLRNKIEKGFNNKLIHTVIGMGYVLKTGDDT